MYYAVYRGVLLSRNYYSKENCYMSWRESAIEGVICTPWQNSVGSANDFLLRNPVTPFSEKRTPMLHVLQLRQVRQVRQVRQTVSNILRRNEHVQSSYRGIKCAGERAHC